MALKLEGAKEKLALPALRRNTKRKTPSRPYFENVREHSLDPVVPSKEITVKRVLTENQLDE